MTNSLKNQKEPGTTSIEDWHFPSLYQSAGQASLSAQQLYLLFQRCHLGLLIFGSCVAVIIPIVPATWLYSVLAVTLVVAVIITQVSRSRRDDKIWFDCRAISESTKTASWRFMMKVTPFEDDDTAKDQLISIIREIREARPSSPKNLARSLEASDQIISVLMNAVRAKNLDERKTFYIELRLRDQKAWYSKKASYNSRNESCWSFVTIVLQTLAAVLAIVQAASSGFSVNVVPILMTCAASAIAWSQMKRYGELAQTYSLAAQELIEQEAIVSNITEEADFLALVEQVEETISREHTMWCARRDITIKPTSMGS